MQAPAIDLRQLCKVAGVTARTVHYYIQLGLLPPAGARGRGAKYDRRYLDRLRLIKQLRVEGHSLATIREELKGLSDIQIEQALSDPAGAGAPGGRATMSAPSAPHTSHAQRFMWERIAFSPDVEIHVRRPLSRQRNRQVDRLLKAACRVLDARLR